MTKAELIANIAEDVELSKADAERALNSVIDNIKKTLKSGDSITISGFGTFSVTDRKAREGRNPATGETIQIKASKAAKFKVGKGLKDLLNN